MEVKVQKWNLKIKNNRLLGCNNVNVWRKWLNHDPKTDLEVDGKLKKNISPCFAFLQPPPKKNKQTNKLLSLENWYFRLFSMVLTLKTTPKRVQIPSNSTFTCNYILFIIHRKKNDSSENFDAFCITAPAHRYATGSPEAVYPAFEVENGWMIHQDS